MGTPLASLLYNTVGTNTSGLRAVQGLQEPHYPNSRPTATLALGMALPPCISAQELSL